jgi:hypothetical protein
MVMPSSPANVPAERKPLFSDTRREPRLSGATCDSSRVALIDRACPQQGQGSGGVAAAALAADRGGRCNRLLSEAVRARFECDYFH